MAVKMRVLGDPEEVAQVLAVLDGVLELAWNGQLYKNKREFGIRAYLEARLRPVTPAHAERVTPLALPPAGISR